MFGFRGPGPENGVLMNSNYLFRILGPGP